MSENSGYVIDMRWFTHKKNIALGLSSFIFEENRMKVGLGLMVWYWLSGCNVDREEAAGGSCSGGGGVVLFLQTSGGWCLEGEI